LNDWNQSSQKYDIAKSIVICALVIDYSKMLATSYICGSCLPVIIDSDKKSHVFGDCVGYPLGWFDPLDISVATIEFSESSRFYFWSDGMDSLAEMLKVNIFSAAYKLLESNSSNIKPGWISGADDDILLVEIGENKDNYHTCFFSAYKKDAEKKIEEIIGEVRRSLNFSLVKCPEDKD
jgi:hypothetical protein